jgi:ribonuclease HI
VVVRTDSRYLIDALTKWVWGWRKRGWVTASGSPVANRELIEALVAAQDQLDAVRFEWVKGHNGDEGNERADDLARRQASAWRDGRGRPAGTGFTA